MKLRLYTLNEKEVRVDSRPLSVKELESTEMQSFLNELANAMVEFDGIGIAAPQVGHTIQAIVIAKEYTETEDDLVLINPRIVSASEKVSLTPEEGCLSVPGAAGDRHRPYGPVERAVKVRVKALLRDGTPTDIKAKGMLARILQHEIDHLHGIVFVDRALSVTGEYDAAT